MSAVVARKPGGPEVLDIVERAVPQPGPGDVLIRVAAAGVNRPDIMQRTGVATPPPGAGDILGLEIAGEIVAAGEGVSRSWIGREVMALVSAGGYAQYCLARVDHCIAVPHSLDLIKAGALPEGLFTVWHNLFERGALKAGDAVLIHGGGSGIGTLAIALAKAKGAVVLATVGSREKATVASKLGADEVINYRDEDFAEAVLRRTGNRGVDIVIDIVGGDYVARNLSCMAPGGRHVSLSFFNGATVSVDLPMIMKKGLWLTSSTLRPKSDAEKTLIAHGVCRELMPLVSGGSVGPTIHAVIPFSDVREAHEMMDAGANIGKIVLDVAGVGA
ncbi:NAD(P)H-quinone oxidoreductase [Roseibium marinum]